MGSRRLAFSTVLILDISLINLAFFLSYVVRYRLALPYPDASFDVVHCSLVVHHLEPAEVVRLAAEMRRVARLGVVVNDLVRGRLAWLAACAPFEATCAAAPSCAPTPAVSAWTAVMPRSTAACSQP